MASEPTLFVLDYIVRLPMGHPPLALRVILLQGQTHFVCVVPVPIYVLPWGIVAHKNEKEKMMRNKFSLKKLNSTIQEESLKNCHGLIM